MPRAVFRFCTGPLGDHATVSAIIRTSKRSWRVAVPVRGSGTSGKIVINQLIGFLPNRNRQQNPSHPDAL
jgi:hypothetical protein